METGLNIIVQNTYISYENALKKLKAKRMNLITSFGKKALKSERFKNWFPPESPQDKTVTRSKEHMKLPKEVKHNNREEFTIHGKTAVFWHQSLSSPHLELTSINCQSLYAVYVCLQS